MRHKNRPPTTGANAPIPNCLAAKHFHYTFWGPIRQFAVRGAWGRFPICRRKGKLGNLPHGRLAKAGWETCPTPARHFRNKTKISQNACERDCLSKKWQGVFCQFKTGLAGRKKLPARVREVKGAICGARESNDITDCCARYYSHAILCDQARFDRWEQLGNIAGAKSRGQL
jgi:hypothetical protein